MATVVNTFGYVIVVPVIVIASTTSTCQGMVVGGGSNGGWLAAFVWSVASWPLFCHRFVAILSVMPGPWMVNPLPVA